MAWSTRELAELAGTTENTVRHYHRLGLLEEPERKLSGYRKYEVRHLVSLLRIRRLAELGVPLSRIGDVSAGTDGATAALHALDAELRQSIERQQKARDDIAAILRGHAPADAPAGFETVASRLSEPDRSMIHIYTKLYDQDALADLQKMVEADTDPVGAEIDSLPADASEETKQRLAEELAPFLAQTLLDYSWLRDPVPRLSKTEHVTRQTIIDAAAQL
ncbi:MerR family transcriptional regulator [Cumulibacter soli]|uniref:MerR family transcriptional regulator n=1 Tax=Cumulibacter soli TaxID=2546344 RepID=UPI0010678152|nr:MerR family transcriptional regulator [Cumulibacter soli]